MKNKIYIEIEYTKFVYFMDVTPGSHRRINLTTIVPHQHKADIKLYIFKDGKKELLNSYGIENLPDKGENRPLIVLKADISDKGIMRLSMDVENRSNITDSLNVRRFFDSETQTKGNHFLPVLIGAGVVFIILIIASIFFFSGNTGPVSTYGGDTDDANVRSSRITGNGADQDSSQKQQTTQTAEKTPEPQSAATADGQSSANPANQQERNQGSSRDNEKTNTKATETTPGRTGNPPPQQQQTKTEETKSQIERQVFTIYFEPEKARLSRQSREVLNSAITIVKQNPAASIEIQGHCADFGTKQSRLEVSKQRAKRAERYLLEKGISPSRIVSVKWFGAQRPFSTKLDEIQFNRRVHIVIE